LSSLAAALFEWIRAAYPHHLDMGLTPEVETAMRERELAIDGPWSGDNFRLFLSLLCEEISDRTPLDARPVD
jgi:hypothetical protein